MSHTVFILGAGASKEVGGPLMADFLDVAEGLRHRAGDAFHADFDLVFERLADLRLAQSNAHININNLEQVFAAFEMAELLGLSPPGGHRTVVSAMRRVIARTLELRILFPSGADPTSGALKPYGDFVKMLKKMQHTSSVMTFNYDIALDHALLSQGMSADYCLGSTPPPDAYPVMKLHGSLNWTKCSSEACEEPIQPWPASDLTGYQKRPSPDAPSTLEFVAHLGQQRHCKAACRPDPVIVPPTWSKGEHRAAIGRVWRTAASHFKSAETIVVIGFSLPSSDEFFRFLYALGTMHSKTRIKQFIVCDPEADGAAGERFKGLLGQAVLERFIPIKGTFSEALRILASRLDPP